MMAGRREGRELFEIFKETKAAPSEHGTAKAPYIARTPRETAGASLHTLRLGDRPQVELFMSLGWVYGLIIFVFMALLASFILGRRMAPKAEEVPTMEAPVEFEAEAARVGEVRREAATAAETPSITVAGGGGGGVTLESEGSEVERGRETVTSPAPVPSPGKYTLRVAYYKNTASQAKMAKDFVAFLKSKEFEDAKVVSGRDAKNLYVTIGSYETSRSKEARDLLEKVKRLSYKGHDFSKVYFQNVNTL